MSSHEEIVHFVRNTLGCGCSDEVFRQIDVRKASAERTAETAATWFTHRILVGNRLLIYVWETDDGSQVQARLAEFVLATKAERDRLNLNRLRVVIACRQPETLEPIARKAFDSVEDKDEKVHLHVIHVDNVAAVGG